MVSTSTRAYFLTATFVLPAADQLTPAGLKAIFTV
jgi:hypothetical protein